jgi:hypothetical protein
VGEREEVRLCGLAGADEQKIRLSRTGERVRRGEGEGTVEETKRKHTAKRKAGIQVDERVLVRERVIKEGDEARPHPVRPHLWLGWSQASKAQTSNWSCVLLGLVFYSVSPPSVKPCNAYSCGNTQ